MVIVKTHRQNSIKLLFTCNGSIVPAILPKILFGALVGVIASLIGEGYIGNHVKEITEFAFTPFTALGVAISLFLGFHNNASYGRWWEARTLWGTQIIIVRDLIRFLLGVLDGNSGGKQHVVSEASEIVVQSGGSEDSWGEDDGQESAKKAGNSKMFKPVEDYADWRFKIIALAMAQTHALRFQLRPNCASDDVTTALQDRDRFMTSEEKEAIDQSRNPANAILTRASQTLGSARARLDIDSYTTVQIARHIDRLCEIQTACERIHNTSLPLAYSLLVHRTTFLFVLMSPFAMCRVMGWWTPVFTAVLAYTFFGLDELARQIQEPFRDEPFCLQLSAICRTIEIDVCEALGRDVPPILKPRKAVLM